MTVRRGTPADVRALVRLHAECSAATITKRFLAPMPVLSAPLAQCLLGPVGGFSLLAESAGGLAGIATVAPAGGDDTRDRAAEVGLLVGDRHQHNGIGTALLSAVARQAAYAGFDRLVMMLHPDNHGVVTVVSSAGAAGASVDSRWDHADPYLARRSQASDATHGRLRPPPARLALAWGEC